MYVSIKQAKRLGRECGDTMVEVLIAIAVVSLILGGAYVTTNRSLLATRAAQERSIALKLAEGQLEQLKGIASDPARTKLIFGTTAPDPFCISPTGDPVSTTPITNCQFGPGGGPAMAEPIFSISIDRTGSSFVLDETWSDVTGQVTDRLQLRYRVYD